jgi:multiple sugar transport system substrate-binding protein
VVAVTDALEGWAFLVARGRRAGYRTVLAPAFLVDRNEHHVLAESTGGHHCEGARAVELATAQVGPFSIGYTSERLTRSDVEAGADGGELLTDEHGRPLEIVYGVVSRDTLDGPLDAEDLRTARAHALQSYRSFLSDEQGHRVDASAAFRLRTPGHFRTASPAPPAVAQEPGWAGPVEAGVRHRLRAGGRAAAASVAAIGVALVAAGLLVFSGGGRENSDPAVSRAWLDQPARGPVRYCAGEALLRSQRRSQSEYNRRFPGSTAVLVQARATADASPERYLRNSDACDVIALDVIYTAEFAAKHALYDMTPYLGKDRRVLFDDRIMRTVRYGGRLWGVPKQLDTGVLYYRADRVRAPTSWRDVYRQARRRRPDGLPGLRLELGSPEGRTVVLLELAYAAGARPIITNDGETADVDQPRVLEALRFLRNAIRDGVIPAAAPTDGVSLNVYESGRASFLRGWPFVAARIRDGAGAGRAQRATAANTKIVPLPPWKPGGKSIGVLGGHNLVIPRSARNPSAALHLIAFLTSAEQVRKDEREDAQVPVLRSVASEPALQNRALLNAVERTSVMLRPPIPQYAEVSRIISNGVDAVFRGPADLASIRDRLRVIDRDVQRVLDHGSP